MAEHLLRHRLGPDSDWDVSSAGTSGGYGMTASRFAVDAMGEMGLDLSTHRSRPLTREVVDGASLIVVMTGGHRDFIRAAYPGATEKVFLLKSFDPGGGDIDDPIGMTADTYRQVRDEIDRALPGLIAFMETLELPDGPRT
jgi:protein-tyrosine-phosphatase